MGKQTSTATQVSRPRTEAELIEAERIIREQIILEHEDDDHPADALRDARQELMELRTLKAKVSMFVRQWAVDTTRR